jgi:apolipoprotein N-acyltransferase
MKYGIPGAVALMVLVMIAATGVTAALYGMARGSSYGAPAIAVAAALGTSTGSLLSRDDPTSAKASYTPQRKVAIVSPGYFRALGWISPSQTHERNGRTGTKHRCPAAGAKA